MATNFVGLENLPNVYFRDIDISSLNGVEGEQRFTTINIKLVVKDTKVDGKFQWVEDDLLNTYLNVTLVQSLDKNFTEQLTNGEYTLNAFDYRSSPNYSQETVMSMVKRLRPQSSPEMSFVGNNMYEFQYDFSFDIKESDLNDVAYFAALTVDHDTLSVDYKADLDNGQIKFLQGPISSEKVFVDGALQSKTNIFFLPDNRIWSGPVHIHQGNYMVGAFHRPEPHPMLRQVEFQNLKLKDNRDKTFKEKSIFDPTNRSLIGTPYDTRDEDYNIKRLLSFNIEGIFIDKTKYGSLIKSVDEKLFNEAISNFKIHKLNIKRKFVKKIKKTNSFKQKKESFQIINDRIDNAISFTDSETNQVLYSDECEMSEIQTNSKKYRYFSFVDKKIKSIRYGNYIHSVEISFIDRTKELLLSVLENYRNDIKELEKYLIRSNKKANFDSNKRFTNRFFKNEFDLYGLENTENARTAIWLRSPENFANLKTYLFDLTETERVKTHQDNYNSINPKTGTATGIMNFLESYRTMIDLFKNKFKIDNVRSGGDFKTIPRKSFGENPSIYIRMDKNYENVFGPTGTSPGYSLIGPEEGSPISINMYSRRTFADRIREEKARFFRANPNLDFEESANFTNDEISSLIDIDSFSTSYLAPNTFVYGGKRIDLSQTGLINTKLLNDTIANINRSSDRSRIFTNNPSINKLKKSSRQSVTNDKVRVFENASEYVGNESQFLNLSSEFATEDLELIQKILVKEKFRSSLKKRKTTKLIKNFDLKKENNVISKKKRRKLKSLSRELRKIPNHLKAVITSRASTVKTNLLTSVDDLLAGDRYNNALLIQHFAVQQIEYLDGYKVDKEGNEIFDFPNWKQLDAETFENNPDKLFICRASQYVDELLEISIPEEISFEVYDQYFVIKPDILTATQEQAQSSLALSAALELVQQESINYDYSTTNPVIQPIKENSIFSEPPRPFEAQEIIQTSNRDNTLSSRQRRGRQRRSRSSTTTRGTY